MKHRVQVISLDPRSAAPVELINSLQAQGITATFFPAVDGRNGTPKLEEGETLDQELSLKKRFIALTDTEIACYLSHLRAIKKAYSESIDALCLLEDDVKIEGNFADIVKQLFDMDREYEFVRLMGLKRHKYKILQKLDNTTSLVRPVKGLCGTQGYVINRKGMEAVLKIGHHIHEPIDKFYDHFWESGLKCYAVVSHIIWEKKSNSSIAKKSRRKAAQGLLPTLRFHIMKLKRSVHRHIYLLQHWQEFRPAQKPATRLGRTERIH